MPERFSPPFIYNVTTKLGRALRRIEYRNPKFDEKTLQEILRVHPQLLAIEQIEPIFAPAVCIGREVSIAGVPLDNLYVSPHGQITIVETKLWKNAGARREVVAQIIEYSRHLSKQSYDELDSVTRKYTVKYAGGVERSLFEWVAEQGQTNVEEETFYDAVSRCLRTGRFLLLIVGEGVRESAHDLVEHVSETPDLRFNLNLVELGCYAFGESDDDLILVPRTIARTVEIERATVRIELIPPADSSVKAKVTTPHGMTTKGGGDRHTSPTKDVFAEQLTESIDTDRAEQIFSFIDALAEVGVVDEATATTRKLFFLPDIGSKPVFLISVDARGKFWTRGETSTQLIANNLPSSLADEFWTKLHDIDPSFASFERVAEKRHTSVDIVKVIDKLQSIQEAIIEFVAKIKSALSG